jgi:hypothetical protein
MTLLSGGVPLFKGQIQNVFRRDGLSLGIDSLDSSGITIGLNSVHGKSFRRHWTYIWDRDAQKSKLSSTWEAANDK